MKKVLIYATGHQGVQEGCSLDEALEQSAMCNEVFFLSCDRSIGGCLNNPQFSSLVCIACEFFQKQRRKKYLINSIEQHSIKEYINEISESERTVKFNYNSLEELRALTFHNVDVGMAALSSYISTTRNMTPKLNDKAKIYFDKLIAMQVRLTLVIELLHKRYNFDKIIFHNGRFAQYKPFLNLAQDFGVNYICTESRVLIEGGVRKNYFEDSIPHGIDANHKKYETMWETYSYDLHKREAIARSFFERRRNSQKSGDKIYTSLQQLGELPQNWNDEFENIVIFNSSEDEFCAASKEYDEAALFPTQLDGISQILNRFKDDDSKRFYVRIHPNLISVSYKYHLDIYELNYPNLTVIAANSTISTYSLIDAADKIIVFGSTVGIEATYWHKPVINLAGASYNRMGIVYLPRTKTELWKYIDNRELKSLYNDSALKYGLFIMSENLEKFNYVNNDIIKYKLFGNNYQVISHQSFCGSRFLYILAQSFIKHILIRFSYRTSIPVEEQ